MDEDYFNSREAEDRALALLRDADGPNPAEDRQQIGTRAVGWALVAVARELREANRK